MVMHMDGQSSVSESTRFEREIRHGKRLAREHAETQWGWGTPAGRQRMLRRARQIIETAKLTAGMQALEIGCGTGLFTERFGETGCRLLAVEISPDLLARARDRLKNLRNVRFEPCAFETLKCEGAFDAVIGSSVLHHLDLQVSLEKIFQLLKPGGRMVFAEPNMLNPQVFLERKFRRWFPYVSPDETAFCAIRLAGTLRESGFKDVSITPFDWLHPATPPALMPLVSRLGRLAERLPLVREISGSLLILARKPRVPSDDAAANGNE